MTLDEIRQAVIEAAPYASHYYSVSKGESYVTWHEYQRIPLKGDGVTAEDAWRFQIDLFTKAEGDPAAETIYQKLDANERIAVNHAVLPPEPDTGYIHHVFQCEGV